MNFLNALTPLRLYLKAKHLFGATCFRSWSWHDEKLLDADTLAAVRNHPESGELIWKTHSKYVYKVGNIAYKCGTPRPPVRYIFLLSPSAREMINFHIFKQLDIPLVQLLAGGESRKFCRPPKKCWVMTRFAEGYLSGMELIPGWAKPENAGLPEDAELRADFLRFNMPLIARLHNAGCYHRGFRPYNIMFRRLENGFLDCLWLDIASCVFYPLPDFMLRGMFLTDLKKFFIQFQPTDAELNLAAELYLKTCTRLHISKARLKRIIAKSLKSKV